MYETTIDRGHQTMTPFPTTSLKAKIAAIPGLLMALEFGPEKAVVALIGLQVIDWVTGVAAARHVGDALTSDRACRGAWKKGMMWAYIATAGIGLWLAPVREEITRAAFASIVCLFAWVEVVSIAENGARLGWPMPAAVRAAISWLEPEDPSEPHK